MAAAPLHRTVGSFLDIAADPAATQTVVCAGETTTPGGTGGPPASRIVRIRIG